MRKKIFLLLLLNNLNLVRLLAQTNLNYNCIYSTQFNLDFDRGKDHREFESKLFIRGEKSIFFMLATKQTYNKEDVDQSITINSDTLFKVIKDQKNEYCIFSDILFTKNESFYNDSLYSMTWNLEKERKMIDTILCKKAICFFRGREYIAWYAPTIPITNGPWKMGGLPGLIIELFDENKDMYYLLKRFESSENETESIPGLSTNTELQFADYLKKGNAFIKRFRESQKAQQLNCITCQTESKVKFFLWEKLFN